MDLIIRYETIYEIFTPALPGNRGRHITHDWGKVPPTVKQEKVKIDEIRKGLDDHKDVRVAVKSHQVVYRIPKDPQLLEGQGEER